MIRLPWTGSTIRNRTNESQFANVEPLNRLARCACGHPREAHEHYRRGCDCAVCPCPRYRRWSELAAELRALARLGVGLVLDELRR